MLSLTSSPFSNLIKLFLETPVERAKSSRVKPRAFRCPLILSQKIAGNTLVLGSAGLSFIVKVSLRLLSASSLLTSSLRNYRSLNISYLGDTFGLTRSSDIGIEHSQLNERGESFSQPERRRMSWRLMEALQKYPEQSFAQKFRLCNRQKFSWRKIKEGF